MIRMWLCGYLPWHKWHIKRELSEQAQLIQCSCGRLYAINHDAKAVLPWAMVREFYESLSGGQN